MKTNLEAFDTLDQKMQLALSSHRMQTVMGLNAAKQLAAPFALGGITYWESLSCVGFDPYQQMLEAVVQIKRPSGYIGDVCNPNQSFEFVRFFIDYHDGAGWRDLGYRQFKASDISTAPPGPQHPLNYLVRMYVDTSAHQRFSCGQAAIAKVRAVLSWNTPPSANPNATPFYGDVMDADIQLKRRRLILKDLLEQVQVKDFPLEVLQFNHALELAEPHPAFQVEALYKKYTALNIGQDRTFFPMAAQALEKNLLVSNTFEGLDVLQVDWEDILDKILQPAKESNTSFEELTCVGLDSQADVLGAVIHLKKQAGYSGNLCTNGSLEYVAFWADWNNNGTYDQYLGTASVRVHDIENMPDNGLYYNVSLPIGRQIQERLRSCQNPNVVRIRAVLSWANPPSVTNPNALPFWGMRRDVLVQLRPKDAFGRGVITGVGGVDRLSISNGYHLYQPVPYSDAVPHGFNRPFGGLTYLQGTLLRPAPGDLLEFRIDWKKKTDPASMYQPVATSASWSVLDLSTLTVSPATQTRPDGWFDWLDNPAGGKKVLGDYLAPFNSSVVIDETVTLRVRVRVNGGPETLVDEFDLQVDNTPSVTSATPNASVDMSADVDIVIDGADCKLYKKGATTLINGHLRAKHRHFYAWSLDLQPDAHAGGTEPVPNVRYHGQLNDRGDDNRAWTLDLTRIRECGYTVALRVSSRVIRDSAPYNFPTVGVKYVGFGYFS